MADNTIQDDVEIRTTRKGKLGYQAVDPITREPEGPLRRTAEEAGNDDQENFERTQRKGRRK